MEHKDCRYGPQPNFAHFSPPHRMDPKSSCCLIKSKNFPFKISCVLVDKFQMKVNYFAYVLQSVGFFEKFSFALPSLRNAMWQYQTFRYEFLKVRIQEFIMLRFDSNAMYLHMQVQDGPYSLTYGPFTHHHQHKKPLLHRACLCHRSQGFYLSFTRHSIQFILYILTRKKRNFSRLWLSGFINIQISLSP